MVQFRFGFTNIEFLRFEFRFGFKPYLFNFCSVLKNNNKCESGFWVDFFCLLLLQVSTAFVAFVLCLVFIKTFVMNLVCRKNKKKQNSTEVWQN